MAIPITINFRPVSLAIVVALMLFSIAVPAPLAQEWKTSWSQHTLLITNVIYVFFSLFALLLAVVVVGTDLDKGDRLLGILLVTWIASCILHPHPLHSLKIFTGLLLRGVLPGWIVLKLVKSSHEVNRIIRILVGFIALNAVIGIWQFLNPSHPLLPHIQVGGARIVGTVSHPLPLAVLFLCAIILAQPALEDHPKALVAISMSLGIGLILTFSRSTWLLAIFSVGYMFICEKTLRRNLVISASSATVIATLLIILIATHGDASRKVPLIDNLAQRFMIPAKYLGIENPRPVTREDMPAIYGRLNLYRASWQMIKSAPLLGFGLGNFPQYETPHQTTNSALGIFGTPDNLYLRLLDETGIVGFTAWILFLFNWFQRAHNYLDASVASERSMRLSLILSAIVILANSIFFDGLFWPPILVPLAVIMGLASAEWRKANPT